MSKKPKKDIEIARLKLLIGQAKKSTDIDKIHHDIFKWSTDNNINIKSDEWMEFMELIQLASKKRKSL